MELSLGSEVISVLDNEAYALERQFARMFQVWRHEKYAEAEFSFRLTEASDVVEWSTSFDFRQQISQSKACNVHDTTRSLATVEAQLCRDARKASRIRMYIGTLLGFGLEGTHNFEDDVVEQMMQRDFATSQKIGIGNKEDTEAFDR